MALHSWWAMPTLRFKWGLLMSNYRRSLTMGGTFFFTVVTYRRQKFLTEPFARQFLREAIMEVRKTQPFIIEAWVLLPDHLHCVWTLPKNDADFSKRWGRIKALFSKKARNDLYQEKWMNKSKIKHAESTVWQRRFWEHEIRDEKDFNNHLDYIHHNPIKHGLVEYLKDWQYSSFHRYVKSGFYPQNWALQINQSIGFGE